MTALLLIDTSDIQDKLEEAQRLGDSVVVLTHMEFEALAETARPRVVYREQREIFSILGVLGYIGGLTIFDAAMWNAKPFHHRPSAFA